MSVIASLLACVDGRVCSVGARVLRNLVRSAEGGIIEELVHRHDCIARVTALLKARSTAAPSAAGGGVSGSSFGNGGFGVAAGAVPQRSAHNPIAATAVEILMCIMECLSKKADDGDRKAAMVQLQEAGVFEAVVELAGSRGAAAAMSTPAPAPSQGFGGMQAFGMLSVAASSSSFSCCSSSCHIQGCGCQWRAIGRI
jgi:hypothetical protein